MARLTMFAVLTVIILTSTVFCMSTKHTMRAATALLFVSFGVISLCFLLDYTFLGAAQISIYASGIAMIYIFAIQLVSKRTLQSLSEHWLGKRTFFAAFIASIGFGTVILVLLKNRVLRHTVVNDGSLSSEVTVETIGRNLVAASRYGYVLPFEFISIFLLTCIIGGLVILNNRKKEGSKWYQ